MKIEFARLDTERQFDLVRLYELGPDGELGALLAVLHGRLDAPRSFHVRGPVYLSFAAHGRTSGGNGFEFAYSIQE